MIILDSGGLYPKSSSMNSSGAFMHLHCIREQQHREQSVPITFIYIQFSKYLWLFLKM